MKVKLIIISIILLLVMVFACGCIPFMEKIGLINPANEEQLSPEKASSDGLVKVLIGFKEKPGAAQQAMVRGAGGKIKYTYHIVDAIAASIPEKAIDALQKNPNVRYVEPDGQVYAIVEELENSWGVEHIGAGDVHASNMGIGVKVAIIDSGIDYNHSDLNDNYEGGIDIGDGDVDPMDDSAIAGHGTHVAGIVAAEANGIGVIGVAPKAHLYAVKVFDSDGIAYDSDVIAGIEWSMGEWLDLDGNEETYTGSFGSEEGVTVDVINMSIGRSGSSESLMIVCDAADDAGIVLVAAAGNSGNPPGRGDNVIYPAAYGSVIAVAATDKDDERARWSSTGPAVELAAPGVNINSTLPGDDYSGETWSGTSMASPHVAGVAALMIAVGISDVRGQLQSTADDLGEVGWDSKYGYGLVNAVKAVGMTSTDDLLGPLTSDVVADPNPTNGAVSVTLMADVSDATTGNSDIAAAEYFVDTVGNDGSGTPMDVSDGTFDSPTEEVTASINVSTADWVAGNQYTLYVHGKDTEGNWGAIESVVLDVTEESSNIMYVESIVFSSKVAGPNKFLYTIVKVVDGGSDPFGGVGVEMTLEWKKEVGETIDDSWNFAGETASDGTVKFTLNKAPIGHYTATITKLILTDYTLDTTQCVLEASCELQDDGTVIPEQ